VPNRRAVGNGSGSIGVEEVSVVESIKRRIIVQVEGVRRVRLLLPLWLWLRMCVGVLGDTIGRMSIRREDV
jgi:hypothetical protein